MNKIWKYIDLSTKKDKLPILELLKRPTLKDVLAIAISIP